MNCIGVAYVEGNAVECDAVRFDGVEYGFDVGVGEDVEALFAKDDFTAVFLYLADEVGRGVRVDPEGVLRLGFGYFFLSGCAGDAVGGKGFLEVRVVGDFWVGYLVVVHRAEDGDALLSCVVCEFFEVWQAFFRCGDVEFAVGHDEVVLGIDIPEDDAGHERLLY